MLQLSQVGYPEMLPLQSNHEATALHWHEKLQVARAQGPANCASVIYDGAWL